MRTVTAAEARAGDIVADPVVNDQGRTLLPKGTRLSAAVLSRLEGWGVHELCVEGEDDTPVIEDDAVVTEADADWRRASGTDSRRHPSGCSGARWATSHHLRQQCRPRSAGAYRGEGELIDAIGSGPEDLVPEGAGQRWRDLCARARDDEKRADGERSVSSPVRKRTISSSTWLPTRCTTVGASRWVRFSCSKM